MQALFGEKVPYRCKKILTKIEKGIDYLTA